MVTMDDTTVTTAGWEQETTATSITITNPYGDNWDREPEYFFDELAEMRRGWHNPRKLPLPKVSVVREVKLRARSRLPCRVRVDVEC